MQPSAPAPTDLSAYTNYFRALALPQLLDRSLKTLYRTHPSSAKDCVHILTEAIATNQEWYYNFLIEQFEQTVQRLEEHGFTATGTAPAPLRFCIPLRDGAVFEMFPHGAEIEVSANNYDAFAAMLGLYQQVPDASPTSRAYIEEAVYYVPVSARAHLFCERYATVLAFIEEHLLQPSSPWFIKEHNTWDLLEVTYAVPYRARLFPVDKDINLNTRVAWGEAAEYVARARDKLTQLQQLSNENITLNVAFSTDVRRAGHAAAAAGGADSPAMGEEERLFWQHLYDTRARPESVPSNQLSFVLQLPHGQVSLKENGQYIAVTPQNVAHFVELAEAKRAAIHRAFEGGAEVKDGDGDTEDIPTGAARRNAAAAKDGGSTSNNSSAPAAAVTAEKQPVMATGSVNHRGAGQLGQATPYHEAFLERYRPDQSPMWNGVALTVDDLGGSFFESVRRLRDRFLDNALTDQEIKELALAFYIPCKAGVYELVPNGRYINVTAQNAQEFFLRVEYEYERLTRLRSHIAANESGSSSVNNLTNANHTASSNSPAATPQQRLVPKPPTLTTTPRSTSGGSTSVKDTPGGSGPVATPAPAAGSGGKAVYLDEGDLKFLTEFEAYTLSLLNSDISEQFIISLNMRWCIVIPAKNYSVLLRPNGANVAVTPEEFMDYLRAAVQKTREIRSAIVHTGRYPPPASSAWQPGASVTNAATAASSSVSPAATGGPHIVQVTRSSSGTNNGEGSPPGPHSQRERAEIEKSAKLRETAIPVPATAAERALFSPTHNMGGLFAPPQHLNL